MPVPAKVNAAYPVSPEVRAAEERLRQLLADNSAGVAELKAQLDARLTLRALNCAKTVSIGRLDSVDSVRKRGLDRRCFQEQDKDLLQFQAVRTVGTMLTGPPLRPLKVTGEIATLPRGHLSHIGFGTFAREAGVAVLRDGPGDAAVVEIPGGKPIVQLPRASMYEHNSRLSPNGRVFAGNANAQGVAFFDAETGGRIWDTSDGSRLLAWLPEVAGFIYAQRDGTIMLADGLTGSVAPHPAAAKNSSFTAHVPGQPVRTLMGTSHELKLVTHERTPEGIRVSTIKELRIASGHGMTSGNPVSMRSGKLVVFASMRDIGWLDLDSGASAVWKTSPHFAVQFAKLDETHLMVDSVGPGGLGLKPWTFDIEAETLSPLDLGGPRGMIVDIGERVGFMRRGNDAWFGNVVQAGQTSPLEKVLADLDLQVQLAKLQAQSGAATAELNAPERAALNAAALTRAAADAAGDLRPAAAVVPGLGEVPADAQVHIVGVYEGKGSADVRRAPGQPSGGHPKRDVRVQVRGTGRPMVLVLASYEPVNWIVTNSGARISAVLLSGYHPSTVTGTGTVPVLRIGSEYAYSPSSSEYLRLRQSVARFTGTREIRSFQGGYSGSDFSVGGS